MPIVLRFAKSNAFKEKLDSTQKQLVHSECPDKLGISECFRLFCGEICFLAESP